MSASRQCFHPDRPRRRYMNAWLCADCAPAIPTPDPARTAAALRERRHAALDAIRSANRKAAVRG